MLHVQSSLIPVRVKCECCGTWKCEKGMTRVPIEQYYAGADAYFRAARLQCLGSVDCKEGNR